MAALRAGDRQRIEAGLAHPGEGLNATAAPASRLAYLDWLRGVAVLIMIQTHVVDSWTRADDRHATPFYVLVFIGGLGAPMFLFLAGVAMTLAASRHSSAGDRAAGGRLAFRRGADIFLLAILFRIQSLVLGWGAFDGLLKVDILNVMGLAMIAAGGVWWLGRARSIRVALFAAITVIVPMVTPIVRALDGLSGLPDPLEAYIRPDGYFAAFSLLPWAGFLFAGVLVGDGIAAARQRGDRFDVRWQGWLFLAALAGTLAAWMASFQPAIYPRVNFWTSSPAFFFIRLGLIVALVPAGWAHCRFWIAAARRDAVRRWGWWRRAFGNGMIALTDGLVVLGRSSLFVYWVHVEMVYGVAAGPLKRMLPLWGSLAAMALLAVALHRLVVAKNRWMAQGAPVVGRWRLLATVLR